MTISSYTKMFKQLREKPEKMKKYLKHNSPKKRSVGKAKKGCVVCGNPRGHIGKYRLNLCRRCFRDHAKALGFRRYA